MTSYRTNETVIFLRGFFLLQIFHRLQDDCWPPNAVWRNLYMKTLKQTNRQTDRDLRETMAITLNYTKNKSEPNYVNWIELNWKTVSVNDMVLKFLSVQQFTFLWTGCLIFFKSRKELQLHYTWVHCSVLLFS